MWRMVVHRYTDRYTDSDSHGGIKSLDKFLYLIHTTQKEEREEGMENSESFLSLATPATTHRLIHTDDGDVELHRDRRMSGRFGISHLNC